MQVKRSFYTPIDHEYTFTQVEEVACNLCGSARFKSLGEESGFDLRECVECGLVYVNPQPVQDEIPKFYEAMYPTDSTEDAVAWSHQYVERHLRGLITQRRPQGGRLLDIGCGRGRFLKAMEGLPWKLSGLETSSNAVSRTRSLVPRAAIHQTDIEHAEIPPGSLDCIVMIAVLEHVKDPRAILARVAGWLAPGGLLVIQVPYVTPYLRVKRWLPWLPVFFEAPRHLFDFSPKTLPRYLRERTFTEIAVEIARPYPGPSRLGTCMIWGVKLPGLALYYLSGRRYVYPFASAFVVSATKS